MAVVLLAGLSVTAQGQAPDSRVAQLRQGGYVLVMRHGHSPRTQLTKEQAQPDNTTLERQLDETGRRDAAAMGDALRALKVPIGTVLTSPAYRARETAAVAKLTGAKPVDELGDNGQSMQGVTEAQAAWLRARASERPVAGNTILVTHQPNLTRAFPDWGASMDEGETAILRPDGKGGFTLVGRIPIVEWPRLR